MLNRHPREIEGSAHFRAYMLGALRLYVGQNPVGPARIPRTRAWELLTWFLLNSGRPILAETLVELLWPEFEGERAVTTFHVCMHAVRRAIEPDLASRSESQFLHRYSDNVYVFEPGDHWWTDVGEINELDQAGHRCECSDEPDRAKYYYRRVAAYVAQGDLALNHDWQWLAPYRERLRQLCLRPLSRLIRLEEDSGTGEDLLEAAHVTLSLDPRNHEAVKALVLHSLADGDPIAALSRLDTHFRALDRELGMRPPEELVRLRQTLSSTQ